MPVGVAHIHIGKHLHLAIAVKRAHFHDALARFHAVRARIHAQRATYAAGDAMVEMKSCEPCIQRRRSHTLVRRCRPCPQLRVGNLFDFAETLG